MRLSIALTLVALAGCGEADRPAAPSDPDRPVQAPARTAEPAREPPDPAVCTRLAPRLVGEPFPEAQRRAERRGCALRMVSVDGRDLPVTEDYSEIRINVRVENGIVTEVVGLF